MKKILFALVALMFSTVGSLCAQTPEASFFKAPAATGQYLHFRVVGPDRVAVVAFEEMNYFTARCLVGSLSIPDHVTYGDNSYEVTAIADSAFIYCHQLDTVIIPSTVTSIGNWAFADCSGLHAVSIPATLESIGIGVFLRCSNLVSVNLPDGLTEIPSRLFDGCINLRDVTIPQSVTAIGISAFNSAALTPSFSIPPSVATIGSWAFLGSGVREVTLPPSVQQLGWQSFASCPGLVLTVQNPSMQASPDAFQGALLVQWAGGTEACGARFLNSYVEDSLLFTDPTKTTLCGALPAITSASIPASVVTIADGAFANCSNLTSLAIPPTVKFIGRGILVSSAVDTMTLRSTVATIDDHAFDGLHSVYCDNSLAGAPWGARYRNGEVEDSLYFSRNHDTVWGAHRDIVVADFPESVYAIAHDAFRNHRRLKRIMPPFHIPIIGAHAFAGCTSLRGISLPTYIMELGEGAFEGCTSLDSVFIPMGLTTNKIEPRTFAGCTNIRQVKIEDYPNEIGREAFANCSSLRILEVPFSVRTVGDNAFAYCTSLDSVRFPPLATTIGDGIFKGCTALRSVVIFFPTELTSLGFNTFDSCINLSTIKAPREMPLERIEEGTFRNCRSLKKLTLTSGINYIGRQAMMLTPTMPLEVPETCDTIMPGAFLFSPYVSYSGTAPGAPWGALSVGGYVEDSLVYTSKAKDTLVAAHPDLTHAVIPGTVTAIGHLAFYYCDSLRHITTLNPVPPVVDATTFRCDMYDIEIDAPCGIGYHTAPQWCYFQNLNETMDFPYQVQALADSTLGRVDKLRTPDCTDNTTILHVVPNHMFIDFVGWSDGSMDNPRRIAVVCDTVVTALFELQKDEQVALQPNGQVIVYKAEGKSIRIVDLLGRTVAEVSEAPLLCRLQVPGAGVYLVQVGDAAPRRILIH